MRMARSTDLGGTCILAQRRQAPGRTAQRARQELAEKTLSSW
jgi:hypothetical protein